MELLRWTSQETELLRKMLTDGRSILDIARATGRSDKGVYHRARYLGLIECSAKAKPDVRWASEEAEILKREWTAGKRAKTIGEMLGRTKNSVIGMIRRLGLSEPSNKAPVVYGRRQRRPTPRYVPLPPWRPSLESRPCRLMELDEKRCHYPMGEPNHPDFRYCGGDKREGSSYCEYHRSVCYRNAH